MYVPPMGPQSWVENFDLGPTILHLHQCPYLLMSPYLKSFTRALLLHRRLDSFFQIDYKCLFDSSESNPIAQLCFSSACLLECPWFCQTLHGLILCYEGPKWLEEFLCIGWLCHSFQRLVEQENQLLRLEEFLWYHLSFLTISAEPF